MKIQSIIKIIILVTLAACQESKQDIALAPESLHHAMQHLTDVIVHDIFSPPVASRIYAYPSIAAYEILALEDSSYISLAGQVHGLTAIPTTQEEVNYDIAAVQAFLTVGKNLIFSEDKMDEYIGKWHQKLDDQGVSSNVKENSLTYGEQVAQHIIAWSKLDNYAQSRTFEKFTITEDSSRWQPTPPAYMEAIEPHWSKMRTFVIDSANQFVPEPPTKFDTDPKSTFFQEMKEVYEVGLNLTEEQSEIASFWDCNPYVMNVRGHVMFATKKITPGGHWIGIAKIACQQTNADLMKSAATYALTSVALADGFISCWDEKYRSNLIRPETVINKYLDEEWVPLLQTPPFPEYTSGHSVISGAAGVALTSIYGENFAFVDSTEVKYGLKPRNFESFTAASDEAAVSRMYGGIHYMPAITNGIMQGRALGRFVVDHIQLKKDSSEEPKAQIN